MTGEPRPWTALELLRDALEASREAQELQRRDGDAYAEAVDGDDPGRAEARRRARLWRARERGPVA